MADGSPGSKWEFDGFTIQPEMRLLLSGRVAIPLTGKAFDTLMVLVANRDRVVTKDELLRAVWPDVVVEEGNLTQQVFLLRKALGESAQQPRYILTIPGHGYRFTADVRTTAAGSIPVSITSPSNRAGYLAIGVVAFLAIGSGLAWWTGNSVRPATDFEKARVTRITESGKATNSAMSADGRYVAYIENNGDEYSVWVRQMASGASTQIVAREPAVLTHLAFSPDGEYVYFARGLRTSGRFVLFRVPATGGVETPVLDDVDTPVSFSPDGHEFAFTRGTEDGAEIVIAPVGGGTQRILRARKKPLSFELVAPSWSPDGQMVAVTAVDSGSRPRWSILVLPVSGGSGSGNNLYSTENRIGRIRWTPDGSGVLTVISETLTRQFPPWQPNQFARFSGGPIWRIGYPDRRAERLTSGLTAHDPCCLDITADGAEVTTVINSLVSDLWIAPADNSSSPKQLTWANPIIARHAWLPDNDTIVYRDMNGGLNAVRKDRRTYSLSLPNGQKTGGGVSACGDGR
jgi:DNA-binding winged helix-turn-helix (wHTH) protein/Tol biopolymer transport system component